MEKQCTGDCIGCSMQQQIYCSSQRAYHLVKNQEEVMRRIDALEKRLSGGSLINPFQEAQEGRGAENSSPETTNE